MFLTLLLGFLPNDPVCVEHEVVAIEFNTNWGWNGFNKTNVIIFYDWYKVEKVVEVNDKQVRYYADELHVLDTRHCEQFPRPPVLGDRYYVFTFKDSDVLRRVRTKYFKRTTTQIDSPEELDHLIFNRSKRRGLYGSSHPFMPSLR